MNSFRFAAIAAAASAMALPVQAQTWYTVPSQWYVGAAGGPGNFDINCDAGNCDRSGTAWKLYGGFRFPNHTGGELAYVRLGDAHADALHHTGLADAKVEGGYWALAGVWAPEFGGGFGGKVKLGIAASDSTTTGVEAGAAGGADRTKFPHVYAALGLGWKLGQHVELTADYDYSRISYRNVVAGSDLHLKQTVDAGAFMFGANYAF